jgi:hypothetical protein
LVAENVGRIPGVGVVFTFETVAADERLLL